MCFADSTLEIKYRWGVTSRFGGSLLALGPGVAKRGYHAVKAANTNLVVKAEGKVYWTTHTHTFKEANIMSAESAYRRDGAQVESETNKRMNKHKSPDEIHTYVYTHT